MSYRASSTSLALELKFPKVAGSPEARWLFFDFSGGPRRSKKSQCAGFFLSTHDDCIKIKKRKEERIIVYISYCIIALYVWNSSRRYFFPQFSGSRAQILSRKTPLVGVKDNIMLPRMHRPKECVGVSFLLPDIISVC